MLATLRGLVVHARSRCGVSSFLLAGALFVLLYVVGTKHGHLSRVAESNRRTLGLSSVTVAGVTVGAITAVSRAV